MIKQLTCTAFFVLFLFGWQASIAATTFQGTVWSLSTDGIDNDLGANKSFNVLLSVDTSGYTGSGSFLDQVAIKVSSSLTGASLLSAPGGLSNWSTTLGGINANGCSGSGGGFDCADSTSNGAFNAVPGGTYSWLFKLDMNSSTSLDFSTLGASVKGRFVDGSGNKVGDLVSENVTLVSSVPEPETYALMGLGLGLMGFVARRRKQQAMAA